MCGSHVEFPLTAFSEFSAIDGSETVDFLNSQEKNIIISLLVSVPNFLKQALAYSKPLCVSEPPKNSPLRHGAISGRPAQPARQPKIQ